MKLRVLLGALALTVAVSVLAPADAEAGRKYRKHRHRHHGLSIFQHRHHSRPYRYYARPVIIAPRVYYDSYADDRYYDDSYDDDGYYDRGYDDDYGYSPRSYRRGYYHVHRDRHYCPYPQYRYRPHIGIGGRGGHFGFYIRF